MTTTTDENTAAPTPEQLPASAAEKTNVLAIAAFVLSFVITVAGVVCGHIALRQIKRTGERGRGIALAATILGYVFTGFWVVIVVFVVPILILVALDAAQTAGY